MSKYCSYIMGIENVDILKENGFEVENIKKDFGVVFDEEKIPFYEAFIKENLEVGYWNEYVGENIVFMYKESEDSLKKVTLSNDTKGEILKRCSEYAECEFESVEKMIIDNSFYNRKHNEGFFNI